MQVEEEVMQVQEEEPKEMEVGGGDTGECRCVNPSVERPHVLRAAPSPGPEVTAARETCVPCPPAARVRDPGAGAPPLGPAATRHGNAASTDRESATLLRPLGRSVCEMNRLGAEVSQKAVEMV